MQMGIQEKEHSSDHILEAHQVPDTSILVRIVRQNVQFCAAVWKLTLYKNNQSFQFFFFCWEHHAEGVNKNHTYHLQEK